MSKATLLCGDCLELMSRIPDGSIDMVLSDLPYGTTRCRWDTPINLQELWKQYRRVVKENGAIVLFSAQPFTTELISSNKAMYRYEWIWKKTQPSGFMNAKKMPLRIHENIEIFYRKPPTYNPQMTHGHQRKTATAYGTRESDGSSCYGREERNYTYDSTDRYPVDVLQYSTGDKAKRLHPTQKPVDLLEYLVKTYTNTGETVLDNCMGADRLLNYIMDGTIKKVPDYTKALEAKDVDFQYIMNFDTGKIEVYKFGEFREAIPFPEKKTPELVGITVRYSNGSTKEIQSGCCVDLEEGSDDLSVEMLNVKPFDLVRLAYGLVAAVQHLGMRDKLEQYAGGVREGDRNEV